MKKVIMILLAAAAFSCGDGSNRASERGGEEGSYGTDNTEQAEPDTTSIDSDNGMDNSRMGSDTTSMNSGSTDSIR
jgi:hypothetical protein